MSDRAESLLPAACVRSSEELIAQLEQRVMLLAQRHQEAKKTIEELQVRVAEGEAQCAELAARVASRDRIRDEVGRRLDVAIAQITDLEAAQARDAEEPPGSGR